MPALIAFLVVWAILPLSWAALALGHRLGVDPLVEWGYLGSILGVPLALVLTLLVVVPMALGQAADAHDRRRAEDGRS